jgi:hypothetical protein
VAITRLHTPPAEHDNETEHADVEEEGHMDDDRTEHEKEDEVELQEGHAEEGDDDKQDKEGEQEVEKEQDRTANKWHVVVPTTLTCSDQRPTDIIHLAEVHWRGEHIASGTVGYDGVTWIQGENPEAFKFIFAVYVMLRCSDTSSTLTRPYFKAVDGHTTNVQTKIEQLLSKRDPKGHSWLICQLVVSGVSHPSYGLIR